jgi:hypothetical protein
VKILTGQRHFNQEVAVIVHLEKKQRNYRRRNESLEITMDEKFPMENKEDGGD